MLICKSMHQKNKRFANKLVLPDCFGWKPVKVGNARNLDKKNWSTKVWRSISVHHRWNQRKFGTQNPPVWPPTKPPTDRHSTNFTKEHKSLKVSHLWSYRCQVSLFHLDERNMAYSSGKKALVLILKLRKKIAKGLDNYAYSACLFIAVFLSRDVTLESCLFKWKSNSRANEWIIRKTILQRTFVIWNEQWTYEADQVFYLKNNLSLRFKPNLCTNKIKNLGMS